MIETIKKLLLLFKHRNTTEYYYLESLIRSNYINDKKEKYQKQHEICSKIAFSKGFVLYNTHLLWHSDVIFLNLLNGSPDKNQRKDRKYVLWSLAKSVSNLEGDSVECGVRFGASSYLICEVFKSNTNYFHHVFDSFEGLSEPEEIDVPKNEATFLWKKNDLAVDVEVVKKNLSAYDFVKYYKGWIPDRFDDVKDAKFKFVHVDVDLYQPTKDSLEFFYDRLVPGGILLCDDYGFDTCLGAYKAFNDLAIKNNISVIHNTTGQGFVIKR